MPSFKKNLIVEQFQSNYLNMDSFIVLVGDLVVCAGSHVCFWNLVLFSCCKNTKRAGGSSTGAR